MTHRHQEWRDEQERRRAARLAKLPFGLMNNTKWREVWMVLAELRLRIYIAFPVDEDWNATNASRLQGPIPMSFVEPAGIGDWIGDPFEYKEILWLRVPYSDGNQTDAFVERVRDLGQLPLIVGAEYVEVRGYEGLSGAVQPAVAADGASPRR